MRPGDILLFNWDEGWFRNLIRAFNYQKYGISGWTHAGIIVNSDKDKVLVYEALSTGFEDKNYLGEKNHYDKAFIKKEVKSGHILVMRPKKKVYNVKEYSDRYLGSPYGWADIIGLVLFSCFKFRFLKLTGAKKLICSEAVVRCLYDASNKQIDFEKEFNKPFDYITPTDIYLSKQVEVVK
jgi:hypothetical protein